MMVEDSTSDDNTTTNKGVNVRSESLPVRVHRFPESDTSTTANPRGSLTDIKNEIQTVLDLMGPTTPTNYTSSDADNEESLMSIAKTNKSHRTKSSSRCESKCRDSSPCSNNRCSFSYSKSDTNQDSMLADVGTYSTNNFDHREDIEHSCCDHAHINVSPECLCMMPYTNHTAMPVAPSRTCEGCCGMHNKSASRATIICKKRSLLDWLRNRSYDYMVKRQNSSPCDLYKINICGQEDEGCPPKRVVFDLIDGIPKPTSSSVATNTIRNPVEKYKTEKGAASNGNCKNFKNNANENITLGQGTIQKNIYYDSEGNARVDYYYFDHGNAQYLHTTDTPPVMKCEIIAEKTERYTTKFWAEFFASIHIGVSFCVSFILQLFKFLLYSVFRPIFVGLVQMWSDYLFKPFLTTLFNGVIQPFLIFLYNIATSVRDLCDPIAEAFGYFCRELAVLFRAIRLCTYKKNAKDEINCDCVKKRRCEC